MPAGEFETTRVPDRSTHRGTALPWPLSGHGRIKNWSVGLFLGVALSLSALVVADALAAEGPIGISARVVDAEAARAAARSARETIEYEAAAARDLAPVPMEPARLVHEERIRVSLVREGSQSLIQIEWVDH